MRIPYSGLGNKLDYDAIPVDVVQWPRSRRARTVEARTVEALTGQTRTADEVWSARPAADTRCDGDKEGPRDV